MKKILYSLFLLFFVLASGCEDFDPGGTATQNLSGDWWVKVEMNDNGTWIDLTDEWIGVERIMITTYNTAANVPTEIFVDDNHNFWEFKGKVKADAANYTFGSSDPVTNLSYDDSEFTVTDGKVLKGAGRSRTGVVTDSITFMIKFNDDSDEFDYRFSGHRRTGFTEDEYE